MPSIAVTAPEKFDLQDLVCIELALRFAERGLLALTVEPIKGEDATLTIREPHTPSQYEIEVQVKGAAGEIGRRSIAGWLLHFPPYRSEGCLLERLQADSSRRALFVASGRCNDAASLFVAAPNWLGQLHREGHFRLKDAEEFSDSLKTVAQVDDDASKLDRRRAGHILAMPIHSNKKLLREVLRRVVVDERVTAADLELRCRQRVAAQYGIPEDQTLTVLNELKRVIKDAKASGADAVPRMRETLRSRGPGWLIPRDYVDQGQEQGWAAELSEQCALLLSGPTRCGKSDAARRVANDFQVLGYSARTGSDVDEAERYLLDDFEAQRLYVLDDPLGAIYTEPTATRSLNKLRQLVSRLPPNRKLIVAQNEAQLFDVTGQRDLRNCAFGKSKWHDLGNPRPEFLARAWSAMASKADVPPLLKNAVRSAIESGDLSLELGCLRHLAWTHDELPANPTVHDLLRHGREDAATLGRALMQIGDSEGVLSAMAIGSILSAPIPVQEIAFMIGSGGASLPSKQGDLLGFTLGHTNSNEDAFPDYDSVPILPGNAETFLEYLERRRFVDIQNGILVVFSHPYYHAASQSVISQPTFRQAHLVLRLVERGLFCRAPNTTRSVARNLNWLFDAFAQHPIAREQLVAHAVSGLKSIFPATRDFCFEFLMARFSELSADHQDSLPDWVRLLTYFTIEDVRWENGEAWLPTGKSLSSSRPIWSAKDYDIDETRSDLKALECGTIIPPDKAAQILRYCTKSPKELSTRAIARLLSYDEAIIRAEAASIWLGSSNTKDWEQLRRIFEDGHPSVALAALDGCAAGWTGLDEAERSEILRGLVAMVATPAIAAALIHKLIVFSRVEYFGDNPPWPIFGALMPTVLKALPKSANFTDARFYGAVQDSIGKLSPDDIVAICEAWTQWLEREIRETIPSDYSLGILDILVPATLYQNELRISLFRRLLAFRSTGALMVFLKDGISHWSDLTPEEKGIVLRLLEEERSDNRWLRAASIMGEQAPPEVQASIFKDLEFLSRPAADLVETIPFDLLEAIACVYCGHPQPLWWLGTHHRGKERWQKVVRSLAERPDHPLFELALHEAVSQMDNQWVTDVVRAAGPTNSDRMFKLLLRHKVAHTANWLAEAWALLLTYAPDEPAKNRWFDSMAAASPAILDNLSDVALWLEDELNQKSLVHRLRLDVQLVWFARQMRDIGNLTDTEKESVVERIYHLIEHEKPRLHGTYSEALDALDVLKIDAESLRSMLKDLRSASLNDGQRIKREMRTIEEPPSDWIGPR